MNNKRIGPRPLMAHHSFLQRCVAQGDLHPFKVKEFLQAVDFYQKSKIDTLSISGSIFASCQESLLYHFQAQDGCGGGRALFIVPSLINRSTVLDLTDYRSFCRYFSQQGFNVYLLEWGVPNDESQAFGVFDYYRLRLRPLFEKVFQKHRVPIHVMGFCMGSIFALGMGQDGGMCARSSLASLAFFAPPWDFSFVKKIDKENILSFYNEIEKNERNVSVDALQMMFMTLDPWHVYRKFLKFKNSDPESERYRYFVAMEDWVNDGVPLSRKVADTIVFDWYRDNLLPQGKGVWGETVLTPKRVVVPHAVFIADKDKIVPAKSSQALADQLPRSDVFNYSCGHTSLVAGDIAIEKVWQDYKNWLLSV